MASLNLFGRNKVARDDLPPVCILCGAEADSYKEKNFSWYPTWLLALIPLGWIPVLIIISILTKRMKVRLPLCAGHRSQWMWFGIARGVVIGLFILGAIGAVALAIALEGKHLEGLICFLFAALGVGALVMAIVLYVWSRQFVRPEEITDISIRLTGVADEFIEQYVAGPDRDRDDGDDDDYEPPPRRPRGGPSDGIERRRRYAEDD